ncbi:hypothetical protein E2E30_19200 (plasmid) [Sphingomonas sp. AAP5]|uniref:hypothetical protein n=1 Tax=unclassified Sphingomonas TaxID=196159 RepID=UPI001056ED51|nr:MULTISPECIES: hypothetical protein [unclassified Sphingomonas]MBB3588900.1 hypothetical protein [Sphingomonas sp. BK481]QBM78004.1 hypothetical protein E2E30_19200 [Sphingomonas sp. AAP5]
MSLSDRDFMRARPTGRTIRLDAPPDGAIEGAGCEPPRPQQTPQERLSPAQGQSARAMTRVRLTSLLAALVAIFTLAWALGCAVIGASLQTEGGSFTPPQHERSLRHGD